MGIGSSLKKIVKKVTKPIAQVTSHIPGGNILLPLAASYFAPGLGISSAIGAAGASGLNTFGKTGSLKDALLSAGGSYAGAKIGGSLTSSTFGDAANKLGINLSQSIPGDTIENAIGSIAPNFASGIANTSIGSTVGSFVGSDLAQNSFGDAQKQPAAGGNGIGSPALPTIAPFNPKQENQQNAPASITGLGSLTPEQQSTNLATQGVYGGGDGPQENDYFLNLINRRLVDQSGNTSDISNLKPIEGSYLSQLGLGGYGDSKSLLEMISKYGQRNQVPA